MTQLSDYGWKQSFSYAGRLRENVWSESLLSLFKKEIVHSRFYPNN